MTITSVAPATAGVEVGDFFYSSWGYDQTNINFYKVVGLTPKGVKVQAWSLATVGSSGFQDQVVPGEGPARKTVWGTYPAEELKACNWCWNEQYGPYRGCPEHGPKQVDAEVETKRLQSYDGGKSVYVPWTSFASLRKWGGQPKSQTAFGYGH